MPTPAPKLAIAEPLELGRGRESASSEGCCPLPPYPIVQARMALAAERERERAGLDQSDAKGATPFRWPRFSPSPGAKVALSLIALAAAAAAATYLLT